MKLAEYLKLNKKKYIIYFFYVFKKKILKYIFRPSMEHILLFTQQMNILLSANISIIEALTIVTLQTKNSILKSMYLNIKRSILSGSSLSDALYPYNMFFGITYINVIKAGEFSGSIAESFDKLSKFLIQKQSIKLKIINALIYPFFVFIISIILLFLIMKYFIPQISIMFIENNITKTKTLNFFIKISFILNTYGIYILIISVLISLLCGIYLNTGNGKILLDKIFIMTPLLKEFVFIAIASEFTNTLTTLLNGGLSLSQSLDIICKTKKNFFIALQINSMCIKIKNGRKISEGMIDLSLPLFPPIVIQIIAAGERTGKLEHSLYIASSLIEENLNKKISFFLKIVGPFSVICIGCFIGIIMITTITPLFEMYNLII